ncbi:wall-associated receptor kinase-like 14 [Rhodamnia argentea]|uniref:Wall-associated receptor kinase-like 14 n=1 Tax=Rhodamnia argentea TaxID=178133 RepID=A0A8B8QFY2_9MYRT|nr:wall-associated receptor kinase-like 14 [Rhodamnia argentea]
MWPMIPKTALSTLLLLAGVVLPIITAEGRRAVQPSCSQTCGTGMPAKQNLTYPFGFSPGCPIQLNCTEDGNALVGDFLVQSAGPDAVTITIEAKCDRPFGSIEQLYGSNYAPMGNNAILLNNCTKASPCDVPNTKVIQAHFQSLCQPSNKTNTSMSCFSEEANSYTATFLNRSRLLSLGCQYFLSAISAEQQNNVSVSLGIQMLQLVWWLNGDGCECSEDADCFKLLGLPNGGGNGFRCKCKEGFLGDGFLAGTGCQRDAFMCNPAKYLSGQCGGTTRIIVLVGGVVVGASLMISLGLICCFFRRRNKWKAQLTVQRRLSEASGRSSITFYPYKEIERATNYFAERQRLGTGAFGTVYAGKLNGNEEWVAIKRIKQRDSVEQVMNEIKLLSSVSHPNLVKLLGCSIEKGEQILIYEFMPNGTLCQHLHRERGQGLAWPIRLKIAIETAQAIAHLHSIKPPIYHRDVKSSNILLDYNFMSKVADFGLSRLGMLEDSHISTAPQGTPGYLDPQYHQDFHLSDKSDVYSLGVVLMEIITSLKVVDFSRPQNEVNLANLATDRIGRARLDEIIDPILNVHKDEWTYLSVQKVAEVAFRCLASHRDMRPTMKEVADELDRIRLSRWAASEAKSGTTLSETSSCSSSPGSISEKLLICPEKRAEPEIRKEINVGDQSGGSTMSSTGSAADNSAASMKDSCISEENSPSSNSLLPKAIQ